ncbi:MAG: nuclear transport factor 2 family protein [Novosphingobium sp.]
MSAILEADYGIRQLHGRYIDAVFRKDAVSFGRCFTDDAQWKIAGRHFSGRDAIVEGFLALAGYAERVLMFVGMPVLDIGDGEATGRLPVTEYVKARDGSHMRTIGVYHDRYRGQGMEWRFHARDWTLYYRGPGDFSEPFFPGIDYGPPPAMPDPGAPPLVQQRD